MAQAKPARGYWPEDILQDQLIALWERLLAVDPIGIGEDFFALGGTARQCDEMLLAVHRLCGETVRATDLASVTVRNLSDALVARLPRSRIIEIQPGSSSVPSLVFLHGDVCGGGYYVRELARGLGADQGVYVLQHHGLLDDDVPESVEMMGLDLVAVLRDARLAGGIRLGGHCCGAVIALEMSRLLASAGSAPSALLMIEPPVPRPGRVHGPQRIPDLSRQLRRLPRVRGPWLFAKYAALMPQYRYPRYSGRVGVFWARDAREGRVKLDHPDVRAVLSGIAPRAEMLTCPGHHISALGRHVRALAATMRDYLRTLH